MPSRKRHRVDGYKGIYYVERPRPGGRGFEKIYYMRYRKNGRAIEEKAGAQYRDRMTPARAQGMRCLRMEGRQPTNAEARSQTLSAPADGQCTFNDAWIQFASAKRRNASFKDDRCRWRLYLAPHLGGLPIAEIGIDGIELVRSRMEADGKSPQTVRHALILLKRLVNFAHARGLINDIPLPLTHLEMPKAPAPPSENLTGEQVRRLISALDMEKNQHHAAIVRVALLTGMRRSAILKLRWEDLDFERGLIVLRGEAAKNGKTAFIPMSGPVRAVFENLGERKSPWVFPGRDGQTHLVNITSMLKRLRERAGLPKSFRPLHGLRHTFASWLASCGKVGMYELQKLLTHSTPAMTQRYAHLHDAALRKAADVAGELFLAMV